MDQRPISDLGSPFPPRLRFGPAEGLGKAMRNPGARRGARAASQGTTLPRKLGQVVRLKVLWWGEPPLSKRCGCESTSRAPNILGKNVTKTTNQIHVFINWLGQESLNTELFLSFDPELFEASYRLSWMGEHSDHVSRVVGTAQQNVQNRSMVQPDRSQST